MKYIYSYGFDEKMEKEGTMKMKIVWTQITIFSLLKKNNNKQLIWPSQK